MRTDWGSIAHYQNAVREAIPDNFRPHVYVEPATPRIGEVTIRVDHASLSTDEWVAVVEAVREMIPIGAIVHFPQVETTIGAKL